MAELVRRRNNPLVCTSRAAPNESGAITTRTRVPDSGVVRFCADAGADMTTESTNSAPRTHIAIPPEEELKLSESWPLTGTQSLTAPVTRGAYLALIIWVSARTKGQPKVMWFAAVRTFPNSVPEGSSTDMHLSQPPAHPPRGYG